MDHIINKSPLFFLSTEHMPQTNNRLLGAQMRWYNADSEAHYKSRPHPVLGPKDITYRFNSQGYRCGEFELDESGRTLSVVSIGASEVIGTGLAEENTFPHVVAKLLESHLKRPVFNWNLGLGGTSADYISRTLASALPVLKPDIVLLIFPFAGRREHINVQGRIFLYNNVHADNKIQNRFLDPEDFNQTKANMMLSSDYNDQMNFYKNYQFCESLCEKHMTSWLFSSYKSDFFDQIHNLINVEHFVTPGLGDLKIKYQDDPSIGLARDMWHPGIAPHQEMATNFFERLQRLYSDRLGFC